MTPKVRDALCILKSCEESKAEFIYDAYEKYITSFVWKNVGDEVVLVSNPEAVKKKALNKAIESGLMTEDEFNKLWLAKSTVDTAMSEFC